ncbi:hypothetical protein HK102_011223, partial [Quaeritorhiza haematococci]
MQPSPSKSTPLLRLINPQCMIPLTFTNIPAIPKAVLDELLKESMEESSAVVLSVGDSVASQTLMKNESARIKREESPSPSVSPSSSPSISKKKHHRRRSSSLFRSLSRGHKKNNKSESDVVVPSQISTTTSTSPGSSLKDLFSASPKKGEVLSDSVRSKVFDRVYRDAPPPRYSASGDPVFGMWITPEMTAKQVLQVVRLELGLCTLEEVQGAVGGEEGCDLVLQEVRVHVGRPKEVPTDMEYRLLRCVEVWEGNEVEGEERYC